MTVQDRDLIAHAPGDIAYLLAEITRLESLISAPRECPHNRVEMLARRDDETVDSTSGLLWSPICRDCGQDVPAVNDFAPRSAPKEPEE